MKEIILIRHGATAGNLERRYIGRTDEPLCEQGRLQALWLQQQGLHVDALLVSPALRARQTAQLAFPAMSYQVIPEWRETDFGIFEGKTAQEMEEDPDYRAWVDSGCRGPVPGGVSGPLLRRIPADRALAAAGHPYGVGDPRRRDYGAAGSLRQTGPEFL